MSGLGQLIELLDQVEPAGLTGRVVGVQGLGVLVEDLGAPVGALVAIGADSRSSTFGEVVGFSRDRAIVMCLGQLSGIRPRDPVRCVESCPTALVGDILLGRVIDGVGRPLDDGPPILDGERRALDPPPVPPMRRREISRALGTGVRAVDAMATLGRGQRMGIFAGPGVGKSTLLGTIACSAEADATVIALIGERGREVRDFVERTLGQDGLRRSVVIAATGDESPVMRIRAAKLACAAAECFRDQGRDALLIMDSVTRFAHAQRQVGLSAGEPPATKGYTPSVFASMAALLERAGAVDVADSGSCGGSITGLYTILVEGDDMTEPIADAARGILDGHLILSRKLAQRSHYPAIDVLDSISRVAADVCDAEHLAAAATFSRLLAKHRDIEELVRIGAYAAGSDPEADVAIEMHREIEAVLRQGRGEQSTIEFARSMLVATAARANAAMSKRVESGA
ncbi:MAG: FliI/YscN family ATPase [Phycisphaeraceae bacterium]|nr:FliI/YscN family ATPase [Phycisphaeraceae bacterium]